MLSVLSVLLATHLLVSPILFFLGDVWIRTQRAAVASRCALYLLANTAGTGTDYAVKDRTF